MIYRINIHAMITFENNNAIRQAKLRRNRIIWIILMLLLPIINLFIDVAGAQSFDSQLGPNQDPVFIRLTSIPSFIMTFILLVLFIYFGVRLLVELKKYSQDAYYRARCKVRELRSFTEVEYRSLLTSACAPSHSLSNYCFSAFHSVNLFLLIRLSSTNMTL